MILKHIFVSYGNLYQAKQCVCMPHVSKYKISTMQMKEMACG